MKNAKHYLGVFMVGFFFLIGCSEDAITISQEDAKTNAEIQSKNEVLKSAKNQKSFVTGQGGIIFNGKHQNFAFHASMDNEGNVTGQWESKAVGANVRTHGTIYCLTFLDEKTAIMSGTVTKVTKEDGSYPNVYVGNSIWFKVVDNGKGNTDQFSDYYFGYGDCIDYSPSLKNLENGNIQVKRGYSNLIDIEGNEYNTVQIGSMIWMTENLRTTTYNDGSPIPLVTDNTNWSNSTGPAYSWYHNDEGSYGDTYGALYNGYAIQTDKLAPEGWHIATDEEWSALGNYLGGDIVAGGKLKDKGLDYWQAPNTDATNEYGFNALPAGHRWTNGYFYDSGFVSSWWSSTYSANPSNLINRWIRNTEGKLNTSGYPKTVGFAVRCVKDY